MAETCVFVDGFDDKSATADLDADGWNNSGASVVAAAWGGNRVHMTASGAFMQKTPLTGNRNIHVLWHERLDTVTDAASFWVCREGVTDHLRITYNGNGTFTVSRAGTTVGTTPTSANLGLAANTDYHFEFIGDIDNTTGGYLFYVNGVLACTSGAFNVDTRNGGTAGLVDSVVFWGGTGGGGWQADIDDVAIYQGTSPAQKGMARVYTQFPSADGTNTAWTASTGSDFQCVDEAVPNGDTDYISTSTATDRDTFAYPSLGVTGTVLAVAPTSYARKDDAGTRTIREVVRVSPTNYDGSVDKTLTSSYVYYQEIWETNPAGGSWAVGDIVTSEFGVKLTA